MLEIACFSLEAAKMVMNSEADRIEFCSGLNEGGLTPSLEDFLELKQTGNKPIFVMIRPRGGDFVYSEEEFNQMKRDILAFRNKKADGFVFGILDNYGTIDIHRNQQLIELAVDVPCSLHRAFDRGLSLVQNLEDAISCGFKTILTSGMEKNVDLGQNNLKKLVDLSNGRINILVGGGLRSSNLSTIKEVTKASQFHSSAILVAESLPSLSEISSLKQNI